MQELLTGIWMIGAAAIAVVPPPAYQCYNTSSAITIDGQLDEVAWQRAEPMEFRLTVDGGVPRFATTARMLWDERFLYIGYHCIDRDIWATMTERDDHLWEEEVVEIFIDADNDHRGYVEIEVNPLNTLLDLYILNRDNRPAKSMFDWDSEGMQHAVHVEGDLRSHEGNDQFWSVEIAIPWEDFPAAPNLPPQPGDTWLMNLYRIDRFEGEMELSTWSPTGLPNYHVPASFREVVFAQKE